MQPLDELTIRNPKVQILSIYASFEIALKQYMEYKVHNI